MSKRMKVLGTDFYWNAIVEIDGETYRIVQDKFTKQNRWEKLK